MTRPIAGQQPDPVDQVVAALAEDPVYIHPSLAGELTRAEAATLREQVAAAPDPVFVVLHPLGVGSGTETYADLLASVHDRSGADGVYLGGEPPSAYSEVRTAAEQWGPLTQGEVASDLTLIGDYLHPDDLGDALLEMTGAMADGTVQERYEAAGRALDARIAEEDAEGAEEGSAGDGTGTAQGTATPSGSEDDGLGTGPGTGLGTVVSAVVAVALLLALAGLVRRRLGRPRERRPFVLPASVGERVSAAEGAERLRQAREEVVVLGERIEAARITDRSDADSWQAALDHYDLAQRVLDRVADDHRPDLFDAVGAIVLARRGEAALEAARAGRAFVPARPCFLNPLHGAGRRSRSVTSGGRTLRAPVCDTCRADLAAGRDPDVLDAEVDGRPVHYFDSGVEPWAATGFGALEPDLVRVLHGGRG